VLEWVRQWSNMPSTSRQSACMANQQEQAQNLALGCSARRFSKGVRLCRAGAAADSVGCDRLKQWLQVFQAVFSRQHRPSCPAPAVSDCWPVCQGGWIQAGCCCSTDRSSAAASTPAQQRRLLMLTLLSLDPHRHGLFVMRLTLSVKPLPLGLNGLEDRICRPTTGADFFGVIRAVSTETITAITPAHR